MTTSELSTVVSSDVRRSTIVNLKQVNELPLRNALEAFDKNGDGKIDITELQKIVYWYGLWKYASIGLCMVIFTLVWSTFGLTIWALNLTKDYTVTNGVLTGGDEVVKMSVASTYIPLNWATLLDRRHLDSLDSLTIDVKQGSGKFAAGIYHVKVASYVHANSTYLKLFGKDGSRVWVNSGTVVLHHPDADEAVMVCGASACNTLAVDVKPEYLQQLVQRSAALFESNKNFELPSEVDGVAISKAEGKGETCMASGLPSWFSDTFKLLDKAELKLSFSSNTYDPTTVEFIDIDTSSATPYGRQEESIHALDVAVNEAEKLRMAGLTEFQKVKAEQDAVISPIDTPKPAPAFGKHEVFKASFYDPSDAKVFTRTVSRTSTILNKQLGVDESELKGALAQRGAQLADISGKLELEVIQTGK